MSFLSDKLAELTSERDSLTTQRADLDHKIDDAEKRLAVVRELADQENAVVPPTPSAPPVVPADVQADQSDVPAVDSAAVVPVDTAPAVGETLPGDVAPVEATSIEIVPTVPDSVPVAPESTPDMGPAVTPEQVMETPAAPPDALLPPATIGTDPITGQVIPNPAVQS